MTLKKYKEKRQKTTPEPAGEYHHSSGPLHFCVQKHAARRLHYDFRLEYHGVLLSWAIPKEPSLDPSIKRLAIQVEDHPLDYQYFEGVIPKGRYGAGKVEIWDHGNYRASGATGRDDSEKKIHDGLKKGHLSIVLEGEKLNGEFLLQKLKTDESDKSWLFIKKDDPSINTKPKKSASKKHKKLPEFISPMLATLIENPFNDDDWLFEIKLDGYRALAFIDNGKVALKSRNNNFLNQQFPFIVKTLENIKDQMIVDGELVVLDDKGKSQFQLMQKYQKDGKGDLIYYLFDLLYLNGDDLRELPLIERKAILKKQLAFYELSDVRYNDHILKEGKLFFKKASKLKLEGIIGKKINSSYLSKRSSDWVKIKTTARQEVVIGGFTEPRGSRKKFGALLVGVYNDKKELIYAGHVGGGFDQTLLTDVYNKLQPLIQNKCPFKTAPRPNQPATWVKPKLVCEVSFAEWTADNIMRQPIFQGLRIDKKPPAIKKETPQSSPEKSEKKSTKVTLTNLDKIYWPKEKYTKGDLIEYYESIAPFILPYLKDRPIMLHRFPDGIEGKDFYQKDINFTTPESIHTFPLQHEGKTDHYLLINDLSSLLYAVNLGSIDLHPFSSRCERLEYPDYCVIDLDPRDIPFKYVIETALAVHEILDQIKVKHYCKTSGGKGLHIYIPLQAKYNYEQSRQFAEIISSFVHKKLPKITSMERDPKKRPKKVYLDCLQNRLSQSLAAPYCVRPRPSAKVSTPLEWDEVNSQLDPDEFTIKTIPKRLKKIGDIFKPVLRTGINMKAALDRLNLTS